MLKVMVKRNGMWSTAFELYDWWDALAWATAGSFAVTGTIQLMRWWKC